VIFELKNDFSDHFARVAIRIYVPHAPIREKIFYPEAISTKMGYGSPLFCLQFHHRKWMRLKDGEAGVVSRFPELFHRTPKQPFLSEFPFSEIISDTNFLQKRKVFILPRLYYL